MANNNIFIRKTKIVFLFAVISLNIQAQGITTQMISDTQVQNKPKIWISPDFFLDTSTGKSSVLPICVSRDGYGVQYFNCFSIESLLALIYVPEEEWILYVTNPNMMNFKKTPNTFWYEHEFKNDDVSMREILWRIKNSLVSYELFCITPSEVVPIRSIENFIKSVNDYYFKTDHEGKKNYWFSFNSKEYLLKISYASSSIGKKTMLSLNIELKALISSSNNQGTVSKKAGSGTGFAISNSGYIVTNYHVVKDSRSIKVKGLKGNFSKSYSAKIVAEDRNNDLAVIKINDPNFVSLGTPPYTIGRWSANVGDAVFALGYPLRATMGDEVKLTNGIISAKTGFQGDVTTYQISVPVQPGNSGDPLFDEKGNVIGIVSAKHTIAENASYAIKTSYLMNLLNSMNTMPSLPLVNQISGKNLSEQVKAINNFVYIIEVD